MTIAKLHTEFSAVDMQKNWELPAGYSENSGVEQKVLSGSLEEELHRGFRTRLLRFPAGFYNTKPFVHPYWEEVFLVSGDLWVGSDSAGRGGEQFLPFTYACRPPGTFHGPFKSEGGCLLLEMHYFTST